VPTGKLTAAEKAKFEATKAKRLKWFREARFGVFLCWTVGAQLKLGDDGWMIIWKRVSWKDYEAQVKKFNPTEFDAKKIARQFGLPVMIHIGDTDNQVPATLTPECLSVMEAGDILCHFYSGNQGNVIRPDGTVLPELKAAMERGVILDTSNGRNNFSFAVARKCLSEGILPTTISTDLNHRCLKDRTFSLPVTMSKFMALGLDLKQVVTMSTINPARAIHEEGKIGSLKPGMAADVSILELQSGAWTLIDTPGETIKTDKLLMPITAIKNGKVIPAEPVALPPAAS